jgi:hypothetical protein
MTDQHVINLLSVLSDEEIEEPHERGQPFHYENKYLYNFHWYHENFPKSWALSHLDNTGPEDCFNCAHFGCINGVFVGYCCNCAIFRYDGTRGRGFIDVGVEFHDDSVANFPSAFDTYLQGVDLNSIVSIETSIDVSIHNTNDELYDYEIENQLPEDAEEFPGITINNWGDNPYNCDYEDGYNDF